MNFAEALRALMAERGMSGNALARKVPCDKPLISRLANGKQHPSADMARLLDNVLEAGGMLAHRVTREASPVPSADDEIAALELVRRAAPRRTPQPGKAASRLRRQAPRRPHAPRRAPPPPRQRRVAIASRRDVPD